jgi:hypothetical protein
MVHLIKVGYLTMQKGCNEDIIFVIASKVSSVYRQSVLMFEINFEASFELCTQ